MPPAHLSLGYWLVERDVVLSSDRTRRYRGLDRAPELPGPDGDAALVSQGRSTLLELRDRIWELQDAGKLRLDPGMAVELRDGLEDQGVGVEVVLADILQRPELLDVPDDLAAAFERQLAGWLTDPEPPTEFHTQRLGLDVTYPFPSFHSAIRQPVLDKISPGFHGELNDASLFSDENVARQMATLANRSDTAWRPFCVVQITQVG